MPLPHVNTGSPHVAAHNAERDAINNLEENKADKSAVSGDLDALTTEVGKKANDTRVDAVEDDVDGLHETKADKSDTYTKSQVDAKDAVKADKSDTYTKAESNSEPFKAYDLGTQNLNDVLTPGYHRQASISPMTVENNYPPAPVGSPPASTMRGVLRVTKWGGANWAVMQEYTMVGNSTVSTLIYRRARTSEDYWTPWRLFSTTRVVSEVSQPGAQVITWDPTNNTERSLQVNSTSLGSANLDDVSVVGSYYQSNASSATLARNYPKAEGAWSLEVFDLSNGNLLQRATRWWSGNWAAPEGHWERAKRGHGNGWTPWRFYPSIDVSAEEVKVWDPATSSQRTLLVGSEFTGTALDTADLNDIATPGIYTQSNGSLVTTANNYPITYNTPALLEVLPVASSWRVQRFTQAQTVGARGFWERRFAGPTIGWTPWRFFPSHRVDNTAGRAIYTWDDTANREQLIYGNTGQRDVTSLLLNGWTGYANLWRDGYGVHLVLVVSPTSATSGRVLSLPSGFRSRNLGNGRTRVAFVSLTGSVVRTISTNNGVVDVDGYTTSDPQLAAHLFFPTSDSWPTTLPGEPVGTIPNL